MIYFATEYYKAQQARPQPVKTAEPAISVEPQHPPTVALRPQLEVQPFLEEHCISCHGPEKEKGDLRLDTLAWTFDNVDSVETWQHVLDALLDGEMPPEKKPRPDPEHLATFIQALESQLLIAAHNPDRLPKTIETPPPAEFEMETQAPEPAPPVELATAQPTNIERAHLQPFLEQHCIDCHGPEKQKGQVRFDDVSWTISNNDQAQRWQDVLDVLNSGEMPPEEEPRPSKEALVNTLNSLTRTLITSRKRLTDHGGIITMRRLNRREYGNTIRELFGLKLSIHAIPEDGESERFDTNGDEQFFGSIHFDRYLELGTKISQEGFKWSGKPFGKPKTTRREPEKNITPRLRNTVEDAERKMAMIKAGKTWKEAGFDDQGDMKIFTSQYKSRFDPPRQYLSYPKADTGQYLFNGTRNTDDLQIAGGTDPRAAYRVKIRAETVRDTPEVRKFLYLRDESPIGVVKVEGTEDAAQVVEILTTPTILSTSRRNTITISECSPYETFNRKFKSYLSKIGDKNNFASIWIDWVEVEGPFYPKKENFFGNLISRSGDNLGSPEHAREFIQKFAYEAFRHKEPAPEYIDKLVSFFELSMQDGSNYQDAMSDTLGVVLASPDFLYIEEDHKTPGKRQLSPRSFAVRLAYFLWSCPPDDELYRSAQSGSIFEPNELKKQIRRMLSDPKADAFYKGFMSQWAELDRFEAISVDEDEYYSFNPGIRDSAYKEVIEFFKVLVKENLPAHNLIDSDFVVVNAHLANHYGLDRVDSNTFQKVPVESNSTRGGFITQTAFLTMGSNGERSSPIIRGTMVLDKILNDPPPPPPPNVPELGSDNKRPLTNRQMVEIHQQQTVCASCHSRIDPIGFGMENYNAIGQWRYNERVGNKELRIEQGGKLISGMQYQDINDLKRLLKTQKHKLAEGLIEALLAYGLGRTIEFSDAEQIESLVQHCQYDDYSMQTMIYKVVTSPLFTTK